MMADDLRKTPPSDKTLRNKIEVIQSDCLLVAKGKVDIEFFENINDYENNVGPGEVLIDYSGTRKAARALMNAIDRDEEDMDTIARKAMNENE